MRAMRRLLLGLFILGAGLTAAAIFGPFIGLGIAEDFVTYRLVGLTRGTLGEAGVAMMVLSAAPLLVALGARGIGWIGRKAQSSRAMRWVLKELLPVVAVSTATLLLMIGAAELYFRATVPFINSTWPMKFDPEVGTTFTPGALVRFTNHVDFWTETRVNEIGFLDRPPPGPKPPGTCRVLFLGDSFVEAAQVPVEQKVQVLIERLLNERAAPRRFDAAALGYSGTGQLNQLPFYDRFGKAMAPDIVVLVAISNDLANNSAVLEGVRNGWSPDHPPRLFARRNAAKDGFELLPIEPDPLRQNLPRDPSLATSTTLQRANQMARSWSYFYNWVYTNLAIQYPAVVAPLAGPSAAQAYAANIRAIEALPGYPRVFDGWRYPEDLDFDTMFFADALPPVFAEAEAMTGFAFDEFLARGRRDGFRLLILASSSLSTQHEDAYGRKMVERGYRDRVARLAAARGIPVVDQYDYMVAHGGKRGQEHFSRDGHWSPQGHRWAAEALVEYILKHPEACGAP